MFVIEEKYHEYIYVNFDHEITRVAGEPEFPLGRFSASLSCNFDGTKYGVLKDIWLANCHLPRSHWS